MFHNLLTSHLIKEIEAQKVWEINLMKNPSLLIKMMPLSYQIMITWDNLFLTDFIKILGKRK